MRLTLILASVLLASPVLAAGPYAKFSVGNWAGGAFTNNQTGDFSHCAVSASYKSGVTMHASLNSSYGWNLGFSNRAWGLKTGTDVPMEMAFDRNDIVRINAKAVQPQLVVVTMPANSNIVRAFRGAELLEANMLGARYTFRLTATADIMPALLDCVKANATMKVAPGTPAPAQGGGSTTTATADPSLQLEAVTLATNFLLKTQLPEPKVLSGAEAPSGIGNNGAGWQARNATGLVRVLTGANLKDVDVAAAVSAADARGCQGRFASGRTTDTVEGSAVLRGFSSCENGGDARYSEFYVLPRKQGGFVMFSVVTTGDGSLHQQRRADFQRAALTSVQ
ncbi:hypothetical protein QO058_04395 [Bosea vestrisii]|uniref:hypothetical protein n=1 Tax=Bosea vestrisii TaxID=151416 RepID=UPI0024E01BBB|nr:hypothetical protein [Bosea vestrisii]WID97514.1 hypothetical protein QO058_04395 [Bosea vestrisii]